MFNAYSDGSSTIYLIICDKVTIDRHGWQPFFKTLDCHLMMPLYQRSTIITMRMFTALTLGFRFGLRTSTSQTFVPLELWHLINFK